MRGRLIEWMKEAETKVQQTLKERFSLDLTEWLEIYADFLLENGMIVPPDELYSIVDKGTIYATVSKAIVEWLPLYVIKNPEKYGYYRTREEAEQALKGGEG